VHPGSITVTSRNGINENTSVTSQPGVPIGSVAVVDPDGDTDFTFHVDDPRFQIVGNSGFGYSRDLKPNQSLRYLDGATVPIQITATDDAGLSSTSPYTVVVNQVAQAPTAIVLSNEFVQPNVAGASVGQLQTFDPNADPSVANTPGEYMYSVDDPRFQVVDSVLELKPGQMVPMSAVPISLEVTSTDATSLSAVRTFMLFSEPPAPPPISLESSATLTEGQTLNAAGTIVSSSPDTATVDFGDGTGLQPLTVNPNDTFSLAHGYRSPGSFTATVRVTDSIGQTKTSSIAVTVTNVAPTARIVVAPSKFPKKGPAKYQGAGSDPGPADTLSYSWTVTIPGKATKKNKHPQPKVIARGTGLNFSFSTKTKGTYTVTLTVTDNFGATGKASRTIKR
jgi:PKD domain